MHKNEVFTSQPQGNFEIDWGNPITRGLVIAVVPFVKRASNNSYPFVNGNYLVSNTRHGTSLVSNGTTQSHVSWNIPSRNYGANTTVMVLSLATTQPGVLRAAVSVGSTASSQQFQRVGAGTVTSARATYRSDATVSMDSTDFEGAWDGTLKCLICTSESPGNQVLYVNGVSVASRATLSNWNCTLDTFSVGAHQRGGAVTDRFEGSHFMGAFWERPLSSQEVRSITYNPWQLFRRFSRPLFTPTGDSGVLIPDLTSPGVIDITANTAKPELNVQY